MVITGKMFRDAVISGANNISNNKNMVDELNVFPVPDGDTGTNMSMTIRNAVPELEIMQEDVSVSEAAKATASAMLRGARGNSGVILSLLFRGIAKGLSGKAQADGAEFAASLKLGVEAAYKSVMKPTEGTVLTVAREAAAHAEESAKENSDAAFVISEIVKQAKITLEKTPEQLPVLKKAGVVDAGGMGFVVIFEGIKSVICDNEPIASEEKTIHREPIVTNAAGAFETDIEFTYCTEFIVNKKKEANSAMALRAFLESIGDCVVVVDDEDIIKVHVHTEHPGKALEKGIQFGTLTNLKIENMKEQHKNQAIKSEMKKQKKVPPAEPVNNYGFAAIVSGAGLEAVFKDLGVDTLVRGGQTSNPSTEDILEAILAVPAKNVYVLPNNKNIIMAAEQAAKLVKDRRVCVLQSRTVPQGISAMLAFDPDVGFSENSVCMTNAMDKVGTGTVTFAVRDSDFEGKKIKQGDILGMENGKLAVVERDVTKALAKIVKRLIKSDTSFVTIMYGADVTDEAAENALNYLKNKISGDIEMELINGGQPVYYYIVSAE